MNTEQILKEHFASRPLYRATEDAFNEVQRAKSIHKNDFASTHEGFAVLLEEVDELWDEVKKKHPTKSELRKEAIQVAAMALQFASELADIVNPSEVKQITQ
jgi:NTP pyrophosphatase (non-canonical NTP hydrolase)